MKKQHYIAFGGALLMAAQPFSALADSGMNSDRNVHRRVLSSFDKNSDNKITKEEYLTAQEKEFERRDRNDDGVLNETEQKVLARSWSNHSADNRYASQTNYGHSYGMTEPYGKTERSTHERDGVQSVKNAFVGITESVARGDVEGLVDYLADEDRDRIWNDEAKENETLTTLSKGFRTAWKQKTGKEFGEGLNPEEIPAQVNTLTTTKAKVALNGTNRKESTVASLTNEGWFTDAWRLEIPNDKSRQDITKAVEETLREQQKRLEGNKKVAYSDIVVGIVSSLNS